MGLLLNGQRTWKRLRYVLNAFALFSTGRSCLQESQAPETRGRVWSNRDLPSVEKDQVMERVLKLDMHKSTGPDGMHT